MFSIPISAKACVALGIIACSACVGTASKPEADLAPASFYTVTAEIALLRHESRVAALQYAAAAATVADVRLLQRAAEVTEECLQPSLTAAVAGRWLKVDPAALDAHRAAARAALALHQIVQAAAHYRVVLESSPRGTAGEFAVLETELSTAGNTYGARQVADRLAEYFPQSAAARRMQAFAALRADDPAAAVRAFEAAAAQGAGAQGEARPADAERRELMQGLRRARILAGDLEEPLAQAKADVERDDTVANRLDYALVLLAAQRNPAARAELKQLARDLQFRPLALRLLGLVDFQEGKLDDAGARFAEVLTTGKFAGDALYYLGMIAERHQDFERALLLSVNQWELGHHGEPQRLRDVDCIGSITGALCGAYAGSAAIPPRWLAPCRAANRAVYGFDIVQTAESFSARIGAA